MKKHVFVGSAPNTGMAADRGASNLRPRLGAHRAPSGSLCGTWGGGCRLGRRSQAGGLDRVAAR